MLSFRDMASLLAVSVWQEWVHQCENEMDAFLSNSFTLG